MNDQHEEARLDDKAGPRDVRTKGDLVGVDDISLPPGIRPEQPGKLHEIKPDPDRVDNKS